jgi:hypothetical protein
MVPAGICRVSSGIGELGGGRPWCCGVFVDSGFSLWERVGKIRIGMLPWWDPHTARDTYRGTWRALEGEDAGVASSGSRQTFSFKNQ